MNHPEDEKLEELGMEISKHKAGSTGRMCAQARYWGFIDGAAHIRTSAEWKAMEGVMRASRKVLVDTVRCEFAEGPHQYFITAWSYQGFVAALAELDRIRKEGESG